MIYMFCADGLEEVEALATLDVMRRGGLEVKTVSLNGGRAAAGPHGIIVFTDMTFDEYLASNDRCECVVLPGGGVGTETLYANKAVCDLVKKTAASGGIVAAICAAPSIPGRLGLLRGRKAVCYPGFERYLEGAEVLDKKVVRDGNFITARGMGCAIDFGLEIIAAFCGREKADSVGKSIMLF